MPRLERFISPEKHRHTGLLGQYFSYRWEIPYFEKLTQVYEREWSANLNPGFLSMYTEVVKYVGLPIRIGDGNLRNFSNILTIHLDPVRRIDLSSMGNANRLLQSGRALLSDIAAVHKKFNVEYVVSFSNARLIRVMQGLIPGYKEVDHLPDGKLKQAIIQNATRYNENFGEQIAQLNFPVIAVPFAEFCDTVDTARKSRYAEK